MIACLKPDAPWTPTRNRLTLLISLTISGIVAGAFHGFLLGLTRRGRGDALDWEPIELGALLGVVPGLATGLAVIFTRRWWYRMLAAGILGAILYLLLAVMYGSSLFPVRFRDWQDLVGHPLGSALLQMAPTSSCLALLVHLFRTCSTTFRGVAACWVLSVVVGLQSQCLFLFAVRASCLKDPFNVDIIEMIVSRESMGGLIFAMAAGINTLALELASLHARSSRQLTLAVAAIAILIVAGLHGLCRTMPLTPASSIEALAFGRDGRTLITAHSGDTLRLWQIEGGSEFTAREIRKARLAKSDREHLTYATNGSQVLVSSWKDGLSVYDAQTLELSAEIRRPGCLFGICALSFNGTAIAVFDHLAQELLLWQGHDPSRPFSTNPLLLESRCPPVHLRFTPDGRFLVGCSDSHTVILWEVSSGALLGEYDARDEFAFERTASSIQGPLLAVGPSRGWRQTGILWSQGDDRVYAIDTQKIVGLDVSPDSRQFARTNGFLLSISELRAGETVERTPVLGTAEILHVLAYSPDGDLIATGSSDGHVQIFRAPAFDAD